MSRPCGSGPCLYTDPMEGFWPIFFLLVVLKIPVFGALWLIWWASKAPEPETSDGDSDGGFKRWRPGPVRPRGPHSGPLGGAAARARTRAVKPAARPAFARAGSRADRAESPPGSCDA